MFAKMSSSVTAGLSILVLVAGCAENFGLPLEVSQGGGYEQPLPNPAFNEAVQTFASLHADYPDDVSALLGYVRNLRYSGRPIEAREVLDRNATKFQGNPGFLAELGKSELVLGRPATAKTLLTRATKADMDDWRAFMALGIASDLKEEFEDAAIAYGEALRLCPNTPAVLNNMAISSALSGKMRVAIDQMGQALDMAPQSERIRANYDLFTYLDRTCPGCKGQDYQQLRGSIGAPDWSLIEANLTCDPIEPRATPIMTELQEKNFVDLRVHFAFDSAVILPEAESLLDELGAAITGAELAAVRFRLEGHTDAVGTDAYNQKLSELRANAVRDYLMSKFDVPADRLETVGHGESQLADPDNPKDGVNRRVRVQRLDAQ